MSITIAIRLDALYELRNAAKAHLSHARAAVWMVDTNRSRSSTSSWPVSTRSSARLDIEKHPWGVGDTFMLPYPGLHLERLGAFSC